MTLNQFINIGPILAGAGILGLAVSFGAQSLVKDVITGFFMLVENSISVGDTVEIAGKTGTVERITLRVVRLRDVDGTLHIIPNGQITTVSNQTRGWSRAVVDVTVAYESDLDRALAVFREEAARVRRRPGWSRLLDGPPEVLGVQQLAERGVTIRTLLRTHPGKQWEVARGFRLRILDRLGTGAHRHRGAAQRLRGRWRREPRGTGADGRHRERRMTLHLYNTMTRRVEPFAPLAPPRVTLYTCGPTVWNYAHIGNFRTFLFEDLLRRWLEASGLHGVPHHEPHRRGRPDHPGGGEGGHRHSRATWRRTHRRSSRTGT